MSISIREYVGKSNILANDSKTFAPVSITEGENSSLYAPKCGCLMAEIEGIHDSRITKNFTRYMPEALRRSTKRWTTPYLKPLIKFHNDQNGEIIGRIYNAEYTEKTSVEGSGGLIFTVSVPDDSVAAQVENRILETVSIGVSANDVRCSICGQPITDASGCAEHTRGELYEDNVCCWDIYDMEPKELSYVIVPSDIYAKNIRTYRAGESAGKGQSISTNISESADNNIQKLNNGEKPVMNLEKELAEAKKKVEELQAELEKANEALKELEDLKAMKAEKEEQDKKLAEIQKLLEDKTKEAEEKEKALEETKSDLEAVTQEKEAAVEAGIAAKEDLRAFASRTLNFFRKLSGRKELTEQEMEKRSIDSIMDSVLDFAEDAKPTKNNELELEEGKIPNPVAPKNEQPPKTEGKDDYKIVNLSEGLEKLFLHAANL